MIAIISQGHLCTHESAMGRSRTSKLVSSNPYMFFKYHQNDKDVKTERLSIGGRNPLYCSTLHTQLTVWVVLIINDHTVVVRNKTKIKAMSLYFKLCWRGKLNRLLGAFTSIFFLTICFGSFNLLLGILLTFDGLYLLVPIFLYNICIDRINETINHDIFYSTCNLWYVKRQCYAYFCKWQDGTF
jgi:hypothetical protein